MVRRFLGLTLGFVLAPLAASAGPVPAQRAAPAVMSAPAAPRLTTPALPPRVTTPVLVPGFVSPPVPLRFDGRRPFFRHHHRHLFFFPVAFDDGSATCEDAARLVDNALLSPVDGSRDFVVAYVDQLEGATALLYDLRAAGYQEAQLVSMHFDSASRYRAEFRLGHRDASLC